MENTINSAPYVINDTDRAGIIVVVTTFCLISVWILFCIRVYIRKVNGPWKWDDTCVAIATVLTTVRSAVVYVEVGRGYGKSSEILGDMAVLEIGKAVYGDNVLYFLAMALSKCAVLLLCQRLTPRKEHLIAIAAVFGCALAWAVLSIMLLSIGCSPAHPWVDLAGQCSGLDTRWIVICALDIVTEVAIFACSVYLVYGLHMSWALKGIVLTAFGLRIPTTILSGIHLSAVLNEISSSDPTFAGAVTAAWKQLEIDFAICSCTLSSLGAFLKPFDKEMGPSRSDTRHGYGNNHGNSQRSYPMNSLASGTHHSTKHTHQPSSTTTSINLPILRPDTQANTTTVYNGSASDRMSVESNDSKKGIIVKQVVWTVDRGSRKSDADGGLIHQD